MKLLRTNASYWVRPDDAQPASPGGRVPLPPDARTQVAVIGAGMTGLCAAMRLREAGLEVDVLEAGPVASGTSVYSTAKLTALHKVVYSILTDKYDPERARVYARANMEGIDRVEAWVGAHGIRCGFERLPALTYAWSDQDAPELRREATAARSAGLDAAFVHGRDVGLPFPVAGAVRVENQAMFDPRRFLLGLARAFTEAGGRIYEHARVMGVDEGSPCAVRTQHGRLEADHVILATQIPFLDRSGEFLRQTPSSSYCYALRLRRPFPAGMYIASRSPTGSLRPTEDRHVAILCGEEHPTGHTADTEACYERLLEFARRNLDVAEPLARWSAEDWYPADALPSIGLMPGSERIMLATGYGKWGLAHAAAAADIFAAILEGRPTPARELYDPRRVHPARSARAVVSQTLHVAKSFLGDRLKHQAARDVGELASGQGGICTQDGKTVAAYRDEGGALRTVSPACTHMGCHVRWNSAEKTWDCPCHGSRFNADGSLLQGPAVADLKPMA